MSVAFTPIDRSVLAAFRGSDESALEQIVRQGFPALADAARADAGDEASAARVVEDAFIEAWAERARFDTPEALEAFLREAVHKGAVRARSRKAALHRFETHEKVSVNAIPRHASGAPLTADEIWTRINTLLHTPRPAAESTARIRADVSRHEAASHVAKIARRNEAQGSQALMMAGVAVVVVAAIAGLAWFLQPAAGSDARLLAALAAQDVRTHSTTLGQRGAMELSDGTRVMLGADTKLRIPAGFGEKVRGVGLEGAASFTVAGGGELPFVVRAGDATVRVTGTAFDVNAYADEERVTVRVREGQVTVTVGEATRTLDAGGMVAISSGQITEPGAVDAEQALAFADSQFVAVNQPLRRVIPLLNRSYDAKLNVADEALLDRSATVRAPLSSSRQAIEAIEQSAGVALVYQGEQRVLMDTAAARATRRGGR